MKPLKLTEMQQQSVMYRFSIAHIINMLDIVDVKPNDVPERDFGKLVRAYTKANSVLISTINTTRKKKKQ